MSSKAQSKAATKRTEVPTLKCMIALGTFPSERMVILELPNEERLTGFADERDVFINEELRPNETVNGNVRVSIVELDKESALVDLPQAFITKGPRVRVPRSCLEVKHL